MVGEIAERMGKELPDLTDHTPVLVQSLQTLIMRARFEVRDDEPIDEKVIAKLAEATRNLVLARRTSAEAEAKIRERTKKECAEDAVDEAKKQGLSAEKVEAFKARILGIQTPGPTGAP